jgi:hypothetical protein
MALRDHDCDGGGTRSSRRLLGGALTITIWWRSSSVLVAAFAALGALAYGSVLARPTMRHGLRSIRSHRQKNILA